jgi:ABC-type transport system substrate-binding protein
MNGEHDVLGRVSPERVASGEVQAQEAKGMRFFKESAADFTYFAFNMDDPVVGGYTPSVKHLRKALSLAYDVAPVIDKFYSGMAKAAQFVIPPGVPEYDSAYKNPNATYNLVQAREHLAKAGYPRGEGLPELVLDAPADANSRLHAEYFARCMERIGIKVRLNLSPWAEMLARVRRRQGQIYAVTWVYDYPDAESGLSTLVAANASPGPNKSNYKSAAWDRLYEQVRSMVHGSKRTALVKQMRKIFEEDAPWILGVHRTEARLLHPWVGNYKIHLFDFGIEKYIRMRAHGPGAQER